MIYDVVYSIHQVDSLHLFVSRSEAIPQHVVQQLPITFWLYFALHNVHAYNEYLVYQLPKEPSNNK